MSNNIRVLVIPETHWDREWYLPFQQFRIKLITLFERLFDIFDTIPDYTCFTLDGQTVVLEDYTEIYPDKAKDIKKLVEDKKLVIGPWYVLPDEFLVSAEATVRNLMLGQKISSEYGGSAKVGYIPDPFGHLAQLPQILSGFDLNSVIFMRGLGNEYENLKSEFWWYGLDGSKILALNQVNGYYNAAGIGLKDNCSDPDASDVDLEEALSRAKSEIEKLSAKASTNIVYLNNGSDHLLPMRQLPEIIKYVNSNLENTTLGQSTFEELVSSILAEKPELGSYKGEMHYGRYFPLLPGVYSARMYIKQVNEKCQSILEKWAEPFSALAWTLGGKYYSELLWSAWKMLIKNHPHDSICGCSIDQVHREMMPRFDQSNQIAEQLTGQSLSYIAGNINTTTSVENAEPLVVFNPHAWNVSDTVKISLSKTLQPGELLPIFSVSDADGKALPTQISNEFVQDMGRQNRIWKGDVCFSADKVPSLGYSTFYMTKENKPVESSIKVGPCTIENSFVKVLIRSNGTFDLLHKHSGTSFHNLNLLEDTDDVGDEYNYGRARSSRTITSEGINGSLNIVETGPAFATIRADFTMELPAAITADRLARQESTVCCPVIVLITVHSNSPRVDITSVFNNSAKDHRLRAHFPYEFKTDKVYAEGQYAVVERPIELPVSDNWIEKPAGTKPVQSFVAIEGTGAGLSVINQGLPEYEVTRGEYPVIAQTLLRCVGWLSRDDYNERPYHAGPSLSTPEAQCQGKHIFKYSVLPYTRGWRKAAVWQQAHQHNIPMRAICTGSHEGRLPSQDSFFRVAPDYVIVSALKKWENGDGLVVRVFNTTDEHTTASLTIPQGFTRVQLANLNEKPCDETIEIKNGSAEISLNAFKAQTVIFTR